MACDSSTMTTWNDVEAAEPDLAGRIRARFEATGLALVATVRADGSPRISGWEPLFDLGQLWLGLDAGAPARARTPGGIPGSRLHAATADKDVKDGDAKISGPRHRGHRRRRAAGLRPGVQGGQRDGRAHAVRPVPGRDRRDLDAAAGRRPPRHRVVAPRRAAPPHRAALTRTIPATTDIGPSRAPARSDHHAHRHPDRLHRDLLRRRRSPRGLRHDQGPALRGRPDGRLRRRGHRAQGRRQGQDRQEARDADACRRGDGRRARPGRRPGDRAVPRRRRSAPGCWPAPPPVAPRSAPGPATPRPA